MNNIKLLQEPTIMYFTILSTQIPVTSHGPLSVHKSQGKSIGVQRKNVLRWKYFFQIYQSQNSRINAIHVSQEFPLVFY